MSKVKILGSGSFAPGKPIANRFFDDHYGTDLSSFLRKKRGIFHRHFMSEEQATSDLVFEAARRALDASDIRAEDLKLVIVATDTPDMLSPSTAAVTCHKLGVTQAGSFDLNAACAGFVLAVEMARHFVDTTRGLVLVCGAYGMSKFFNWEDYKVTSVFADGAGALVLGPSDKEGFLVSEMLTEGHYHDYMGIYAGGTKFPINEDRLQKKEHLLAFVKRIPPETNGIFWPKIVHSLLDRAHLSLENVDHFFFTQINIESIRETMNTLNVPQEKAHNIMDRFGYTGSACIPMAIDDAAKIGKLKKGDICIMVGSGGGMAMAGQIFIW